jgi:hypothetical protein
MNTIRRHPLAALLALLALVAPTGAARAEALVSSLVGDSRPGTVLRVGDPSSRIGFRAGRRGDEEEESDETADGDTAPVLQLMAVILAVPAGTTPTTMTSTTTSTVVKTSSAMSNSPGPGDGGSNGPGDGGPSSSALAPEPGGLLTAVIGSALSALAVLRRRQRLRPA